MSEYVYIKICVCVYIYVVLLRHLELPNYFFVIECKNILDW